MPFKTLQHNVSPQDTLPQHLSHKPIYALPYQEFDGYYVGETDMRYISVGIAQYDENEVSLKTFRHVGEKWTRQSEELPLHRAVDAVHFLVKTLYASADGNINIPAGTFHNQTDEMVITREDRSYGQLATFNKYLDDRSPLLTERVNALYKTLKQLKEVGKF